MYTIKVRIQIVQIRSFREQTTSHTSLYKVGRSIVSVYVESI